jgi:hypothetical protein
MTSALLLIYNAQHPGSFFPRDYTRLRLNRKRLLAMKGDARIAKGGYVISSPTPVGPEGFKPTWVQVKEVDV